MKLDLENKKLSPLLLRVGLAVVLTYAAVSSLMHSDQWVGYMPTFIAQMHDATSVVKLFAVLEILLTVWLLSGKLIRYAAIAAALLFAGIILAQPSNLVVTFRDIGLLFMALALAVTP